MVKLRERMVLEMMKELFPPLNKSGSADAFYKVADSILTLPAMQALIKDAERIRKANEYLEGIEGIEINDIHGMVAMFNALSIIVRTGEGEDVTENFRRPE